LPPLSTVSSPGIPLDLVKSQGAGVLVTCLGCARTEGHGVDNVIERLNARGLRGAEVGVVELAQHVRGACIKCGAENWLTGPDWQAAGRAA